VLFFLCKGTTCASLSLSGNVDVSKDLFIRVPVPDCSREIGESPVVASARWNLER
jgi:hypothetical protein